MSRTQTAPDSHQRRHSIDSLDDLDRVAEDIVTVSRHNTTSVNPETGESETVGWRDTLWTDTNSPTIAGNVTSNSNWYHIIQYGDILSTISEALRAHDRNVGVSGHVNLSKTAHRMTGSLSLNETIEPTPGDEISLELHFSSGHSGSQAVRFQVGATRLICSNGMTAFIADACFEQTHQHPLNAGLAHDSIASILDSDSFEKRLADAHDLRLRNEDEAMFVIFDVLGNEEYLFDDPITAVRDGIENEVSSEQPSLYETYQAATWALSHNTRNVPDHVIADEHVKAARILDQHHSDDSLDSALPDPVELGSSAVERRSDQFYYNSAEERWDGERNAVRALL